MDISDERIRAMLRGRREVRLVPLPGFEDGEDVMVGVRVLAEEDIDAARANATQYASAIAKQYNLDAREMLSLDAEMLDREVERQIVYRAFVNPEKGEGDYKPFFGAIQHVRKLDSVMHRTLFNMYLHHQDYVNPLRGLDEGEVNELAEALKKTPETEAMLALCDVRTLLRLARTLAAQLRSALTGK